MRCGQVLHFGTLGLHFFCVFVLVFVFCVFFHVSLVGHFVLVLLAFVVLVLVSSVLS